MSDSRSNLLAVPTQAPKLLDRLRSRLQDRGFSLDQQNRLVEWSRQKGDVIDLWASVNGMSLRDVALNLVATFRLEPAPPNGTQNRYG